MVQSATEHKIDLSRYKQQIDFIGVYTHVSQSGRMFETPIEELPIYHPFKGIIEPADVYFALLKDKTPYYKIGVTGKLFSRMANISGSEKVKVKLLAYVHFDDRKDAIVFEDAIHRLLNPYAFRGREWYHFNTKELTNVMTMFNSMAMLRKTEQRLEKAA